MQFADENKISVLRYFTLGVEMQAAYLSCYFGKTLTQIIQLCNSDSLKIYICTFKTTEI